MNSNLFHNLANVASVLLAMATAGLIASGCAEVAGKLDCSASWLNPTWTAVAIAVLQAVKLGVNIVRDGLSGLTKPQPPVSS